MAARRGKILVIRGGAIGDFILTLPAISALRETFPHTHLEVLGYPAVAELARAAGIIDASRSIEARPLARFFARNAQLDEEWSDYFDSFNVIVSYLYDPDDIFKTNIGRVSAAQFLQGQHRPLETEDLHATAVFLKPLENLAIYDTDPLPRLALPASESLAGGPWIAAHPGSGSEKKNWPEEKWRELLRSVVGQAGRRILLVGGEAEGDRLTRLAREFAAEQVRVAQGLPLSELGGRLKACRLFLGHDSGISHLAAAVGMPVLALWGPTRPEIWRPPHPHVRLLSASGGLENLAVNQVETALRELLG